MEDLIRSFMTIQPIDGDGYGDGSGKGDGYGDDSGGYGYGSGKGDGSGYGSGSGDGSGDGYGDGDGDGYGKGYGALNTFREYRKGFLTKQIASLKSFKGRPVYYVDNIACTFLSIVNNVAKVEVIRDDFSTEKMYIAKSGNLFAHGKTKTGAIQAVSNKFYACLSFEQRKAEFIRTFKLNQSYSNKVWFEWHHHLTGSCEKGRRMFVESKGIDLNGKMTTYEFLTLTANEYSGEAIRGILNEMQQL